MIEGRQRMPSLYHGSKLGDWGSSKHVVFFHQHKVLPQVTPRALFLSLDADAELVA